jgi:hypothetical protein
MSLTNLLSLDVVAYANCLTMPVCCHVQPGVAAQGADDVFGAHLAAAGPVHAIFDSTHAPLSST